MPRGGGRTKRKRRRRAGRTRRTARRCRPPQAPHVCGCAELCCRCVRYWNLVSRRNGVSEAGREWGCGLSPALSTGSARRAAGMWGEYVSEWWRQLLRRRRGQRARRCRAQDCRRRAGAAMVVVSVRAENTGCGRRRLPSPPRFVLLALSSPTPDARLASPSPLTIKAIYSSDAHAAEAYTYTPDLLALRGRTAGGLLSKS